MIEKIHIQNFKCLRDVTVELGPFNVLIGPNDSGKTSFLDAIQWLGQEKIVGDRDSYVWQREKNRTIFLRAIGKSGLPFDYSLDLPPGGNATIEHLTFNGKDVLHKESQDQSVSISGDPASYSLDRTLLSIHELARNRRHYKGSNDPLSTVSGSLASVREYRFDPNEMRKLKVPGVPKRQLN